MINLVTSQIIIVSAHETVETCIEIWKR